MNPDNPNLRTADDWAKRYDLLAAELESVKRERDVAVKGLEFYANCDNWETAAIDDLCKVKTKLNKDKESFGEVDRPGSASKLVLYGGKLARETLQKIGRGK
jgi:hypothetical protein